MTPDDFVVFEETVLAGIELNRARWEHTGNPVYVWKAISACFMLGAASTRLLTGSMPDPLPGAQPHPLPAWCLLYLGTIATRIDCLTEGKDFRLLPKPFGHLEPTAEVWENSRAIPPSLDPLGAAETMAQALGFIRDGWNAFERSAALAEKELDDFSEWALRSEGKSASEAMTILLQETGINDERTMRRRLAEARAARRGKPTT